MPNPENRIFPASYRLNLLFAPGTDSYPPPQKINQTAPYHLHRRFQTAIPPYRQHSACPDTDAPTVLRPAGYMLPAAYRGQPYNPHRYKSRAPKTYPPLIPSLQHKDHHAPDTRVPAFDGLAPFGAIPPQTKPREKTRGAICFSKTFLNPISRMHNLVYCSNSHGCWR